MVSIVTSKLEEYDKEHPPNFCCPICKLSSDDVIELSKHIVQCKLDTGNRVSNINTFDESSDYDYY